MTQSQYIIARKLSIVELGETLGNISDACRKMGVNQISESVEALENTESDIEDSGPELIDGKEVSDNHMAFEKWASEKFSEKDWLKKSGLLW